MANDWRIFRTRHADLIEEIHRRRPGFELRDLAQAREQRSTTTRGAIVREFPENRALMPRTGGPWAREFLESSLGEKRPPRRYRWAPDGAGNSCQTIWPIARTRTRLGGTDRLSLSRPGALWRFPYIAAAGDTVP